MALRQNRFRHFGSFGLVFRIQNSDFVVFENITQSLGKAFSAFRGTGKITESNIRDGMQQVLFAVLQCVAVLRYLGFPTFRACRWS